MGGVCSSRASSSVSVPVPMPRTIEEWAALGTSGLARVAMFLVKTAKREANLPRSQRTVVIAYFVPVGTGGAGASAALRRVWRSPRRGGNGGGGGGGGGGATGSAYDDDWRTLKALVKEVEAGRAPSIDGLAATANGVRGAPARAGATSGVGAAGGRGNPLRDPAFLRLAAWVLANKRVVAARCSATFFLPLTPLSAPHTLTPELPPSAVAALLLVFRAVNASASGGIDDGEADVWISAARPSFGETVWFPMLFAAAPTAAGREALARGGAAGGGGGGEGAAVQ
jgi:hypothetical protein